jgi:hypothetical protein
MDYSRQIYALAALDMKPGREWMDRFLVGLRPHLTGLPAHDLTSIIWALGRLDHRPGVDWMQRFFDQVNVLTGGGGVEALPQLSVGFGTVILHGVTMWAAQRLDYTLEAGLCRSCSCSHVHGVEQGLDSSSSSNTTSIADGHTGSRGGHGEGDGGLEVPAGVTLQMLPDGAAAVAVDAAAGGGRGGREGGTQVLHAVHGMPSAIISRTGGFGADAGVGVQRGLPQLSLVLPAV